MQQTWREQATVGKQNPRGLQEDALPKKIVGLVEEKEPVSYKQVAEKVDASKRTVVACLSKLHERGYLDRAMNLCRGRYQYFLPREQTRRLSQDR